MIYKAIAHRYEVTPSVDPSEGAAVAEQSVGTALRWGGAQLDVVRRAAGVASAPYQTYLKQAAFRCALIDLQAAREVGVEVS